MKIGDTIDLPAGKSYPAAKWTVNRVDKATYGIVCETKGGSIRRRMDKLSGKVTKP